MKVAHVFRALNAGGIERWLTDFANENNKSERFDIHFITQTSTVGFFEKQLEENAVNVCRIEIAKGYASYLWKLFIVFKRGKFDVIHSHVHHFSGIVCMLAFLAGVKIRVAHCHNDKREIYSRVHWHKKAYFWVCRLLLKLFCNRRIAVSPEASYSLFGSTNKVTVLPCGISYKKLHYKIQKASWPIVLGHVGSFTTQKNHKFLIEVFSLLNQKYPGYFELCLIGGGRGFESIKLLVEKKEISGVSFLGVRSDVPELLSTNIDVFVMPSLHEGLSMALIEAQYYGCSVVASNKISPKHKLSKNLVFSEIDNPELFAKDIYNLAQNEILESEQAEIRKIVDKSPLSVSHNSDVLKKFYSDSSFYYNFFKSF